MRLFTPGHSTYTDTLMLYGLCRALYLQFGEEFKGNFLKATRIGQQYMIEMEANVDEIVEALMRIPSSEGDRMYSQLTEAGSPLGLFGERDVEEALETLRDEEGLRGYLNDLQEIGHSARRGEGRGGRGKTVKLPLMPLAGKYQHRDLTSTPKFAAKSYKACKHCRALTLLGFLNSVYGVRGREGRMIITLPFEGMVEADFFSDFFAFYPMYWEQFFDELRRVRLVDQVPIRTATYIVISLFSGDLIDAMTEAEAGWHSIGIRFAGRPGAPEVRGFCELELTSFIEGLNRLYKQGIQGLTPIQNLIYLLISQGDANTLDSLFNFISKGRAEDMYEAVRGAHSTLQQAKLKGVRGVNKADREFHIYFNDMARALLRG